MPVFQLIERHIFPPVHLSEPDGLLAVGGDLDPERLLLAYRSGIFPWYSGDEILWWSPDPRFVLIPSDLKVSKSMEKLIRNEAFRFTTNQQFEQVISHCKSIDRPGQDGTWLNEEMQAAYTILHRRGFAHSAEAWQGDQLVGGLYGIKIGRIFFGESMFSLVSNASKFAFIQFTRQLAREGIILIDCQVHTAHLESLGAKMIAREEFIKAVGEGIVNCEL